MLEKPPSSRDVRAERFSLHALRMCAHTSGFPGENALPVRRKMLVLYRLPASLPKGMPQLFVCVIREPDVSPRCVCICVHVSVHSHMHKYIGREMCAHACSAVGEGDWHGARVCVASTIQVASSMETAFSGIISLTVVYRSIFVCELDSAFGGRTSPLDISHFLTIQTPPF